MSGLTSTSEASVSSKHLYSALKIARACGTEACGMPMPIAISSASASVRPSTGSMNTFLIFSGVLAATSSMSMPPSEDAISTTFCVPRSTTMPT